MFKQWNGFKGDEWKNKIDVSDFIQKNYTLYEGDDSFLVGKTAKTNKVWDKAYSLILKEIKQGIIDVETNEISGIDNFAPGYIDKENEVIVGFQTDAPLKRIVNPFGGFRMVEQSLEEYGFKLNKDIENFFPKYRKTHNEGVFDAYSPATKVARNVGLLTGLPDAYGRGRIIGDYRRVALYGIDFLIEEKKKDLTKLTGLATDSLIRHREEVSMQIRALAAIKSMASKYGVDISKPATTAVEATQAVYFGYLAGIKENNGAAMSLGRTTTFLDIYMQRDLAAGILTEDGAQEIVDQFVIKLRMARHLRTPEYNELFGGDPNWVTESIGGVAINGKAMVTKTSFRFLHTLTNLGSAPEPNMTVLWSEKLPEPFKKYCAKMSIETDALQYENDDVMRPIYGEDYGIACCVSAMEIGKRMQFFGARANLAKSLLLSLNGGMDELKGKLVIPGIEKTTDEILDYKTVRAMYSKVLAYVAEMYVDTMNTIHYMHDKYAYEAGQLSLHDTDLKYFMAFGVAGLSVAADSLSAIKFAKVSPIRNENGITVDFKIEGDFPKYGNDDDRVDDLAVNLIKEFSDELKKHPAYKNAEHTLSALTITSNVVYGKKTGATPDGRKQGIPLAPGANPTQCHDENGALASLNSVAKIPYRKYCQDGVSNTFSIVPAALGIDEDTRINNLVFLLDGYFAQSAHHLNVNVLNRDVLIDAMENPDKYPTLTVRVSGYAVHFNRLSKEQQLEVISRTFHKKI
ncbi:formate C-acetyltransferase [Clostridium tagluense]|uniref:formate C-acetyltransferase n=1 Tax=Clostridium tagluense TaxID=360422 RepID=UPI001C0B580B|nr:formate C-acetyltransferase [Clostridium tagluense]MBU3127075.1 formate C-acetyltransferase [Clostridium tagluense]MCB2311076.1 formate C-acetyltransferase [Clostridium tagluense]MCB2318353.1 formate C-acetyltransferase [Clostridium tagluense]MCB2323173.1 formate C-acetyltransferase [Clostridium tagluense]MCB2325598.1 formate C-acetyltransferase [Clostridium tagluense]